MSAESVPSAPPSMIRLVEELNRLPGIGPKSAQRLAYHIIRLPEDEVYALSDAMNAVKKNTIHCGECQNLSEANPCRICDDLHRDKGTICVVEEPLDVMALERSCGYRGIYHVLHGALSPLNGIRPEDLKLTELLTRVEQPQILELVVATNPTLEGEATAMYIQRHVMRDDLRITRLARGIPVGGSLEHTDETTLKRAFQGRQEL